jgi:Concanavalin A-like lectin/glucanases superfamily
MTELPTMPTLPTLDDRTFADFANDARAMIPSLAPGWTDHNPTDPGIILLELFAWLAEIVLYRIDRVPDRSYRTFLRLLRGEVPTAPDGSALPLGDAIRTTIAELRERYRAVTTDDFEYLALHRWPALPPAIALGVPGMIRRAHCIAEHNPATLPLAWKTKAPPEGQGHFTLVVVPDCLAASKRDLLAFDPGRRYALELDGKASYVDCGNDPSLAITASLTLSAWIFPRNLSHGRQGILCKSASGEFELYVEPDGTLGFRHADGVDGGATTAQVPVGQWTHVAAVRDGTALTLYLDGKLAGSATLARPAVATTAHVVIGRLSSGTGFFDGFLRDVCVWKGVRSAVDLGGDLQHTPTVPSDPHAQATLIACWRADAIAAPVLPNGPAVIPDAATPQGAATRPRDGTPNAVLWRDVLRPLVMQPPLHDGLFALLDEWRLLTTRVDVIDQRPLRVKVSASLYLRPDGVATDVKAAATLALDTFLDPLRGWQGTGWPFGRPIFVSDLNAALDGLPGVDFVEGVAVDIVNDVDPSRQPRPTDEAGVAIGVRLQPNELPVLDQVDFKVFQRRGVQWLPA